MMETSPIDQHLYNAETGAPFERCLVCPQAVQTTGEEYFVERIFRRLPELALIEPIFEYAMCAACAEDMRKEVSSESMKSIQSLFEERLKTLGIPPFEDRFETCLLTGKPIAASSEFSYHGHCQGDRMLRSIFPYAISDEAMNLIGDLLSDKTIDQLDDFKGRYFTGPPELAAILNPKRLLLL
jgi:hypothetical protein